MKSTLCFSFFLIMSLSFHPLSAQYDWQWVITEGAENNEYIKALTCDEEGNIFATGAFRGTVDFFGETIVSAGDNDIFVAGFNPDGALQWVTTGGGEFEEIGWDIQTDNNHIYVAGSFTVECQFGNISLESEGARDALLLKYDMNGNLLWATSGGSVVDDAAKSLDLDDAGNPYIAGDINFDANFGECSVAWSGLTDLFVAKYTPGGNCEWAAAAGGTSYDYARCITVGQDGGVAVGGRFAGTATFGDQQVTAVDIADVYIATYDSDGIFDTVVTAGGMANDDIVCMARDNNDNVYVGGWFMENITIGGNTYNSAGSYDILLARFNPQIAQFTWSAKYGGAGSDEAIGIYCDAANNLVVTGTFENSLFFGEQQLVSDGFDDGFMVRFDPDMMIDLVFQAGGSGGITVHDCTGDEDGNYYFGGDFLEELVIGDNTFMPNGAYDLFLARLGEGGASIPNPQTISHIQMQLSPNPVAEMLFVNVRMTRLAEVSVTIIDLTGKQMLQRVSEKEIKQNFSIELNLAEIPPGLYFCVLETGKGRLVKRFVKR